MTRQVRTHVLVFSNQIYPPLPASPSPPSPAEARCFQVRSTSEACACPSSLALQLPGRLRFDLQQLLLCFFHSGEGGTSDAHGKLTIPFAPVVRDYLIRNTHTSCPCSALMQEILYMLVTPLRASAGSIHCNMHQLGGVIYVMIQ